MGERVSIQFGSSYKVDFGELKGKTFEERSVVLCDHWGGPMKLVELAQNFIKGYAPSDELSKMGASTPQTRREPQHLMVEFIGWLGESAELTGSVYLGENVNRVDNSDYGNYVIDSSNGEIHVHEIECLGCGNRKVDEKKASKRKIPSPYTSDWTAEVCPKCAKMSEKQFLVLYKKSHPWLFKEK